MLHNILYHIDLLLPKFISVQKWINTTMWYWDQIGICINFRILISINSTTYSTFQGHIPLSTPLKGLLYRIILTPQSTSLVKLPFKTAWNDSYFKHRFPVSKPFCFIVFMNWIKQDVGITTYLREKFPNAKLVCILQDLAALIHSIATI